MILFLYKKMKVVYTKMDINTSISNINNVNINELLDIYFKNSNDSNKYDSFFIAKIQPIFKANLINFLNDFIYQISDADYFQSYKQYFTNIRYNNLDQEKYKAFAITSLIQYSDAISSQRDFYRPLLQQKINGMTYDIYGLIYHTVYDYFYDYFKQYTYLKTYKKDIYTKLLKLASSLLNDFVTLEEDYLIRYFKIYENTKYILVQFYGEDSNDTTGCTPIQSYSTLKEAIQHLDNYVQFEFKINPTDIYYNNLIYSKNKSNVGIILSQQNFDTI